MSIRGPLLTVRQGSEGTFVRWLEDLGLKDFLRRFPIPKLVEWGWLVPQYRYSFPPEEFVKDVPQVVHFAPPPRDKPLEQLWDQEWYIRSNDEPFWFLNPFFRPDNAVGQMLRNPTHPWSSIPIPPSFEDADGFTITPYVDYFFHWQGYALIEVICFSDCFPTLFNTPDIDDQVQVLARIAESAKKNDPRPVLTAPARWGGLAQLMTWLSHYRAMRDAVYWREAEPNSDRTLRRRGAAELAGYLGITPDVLEATVKNDLLRLAREWNSKTGRRHLQRDAAWSNLQFDIYYAVEWLCTLTGKSFDDFFELWGARKDRMNDGTAQLNEALPFEFVSERLIFLDNAPYYLEFYNALLPEAEQLANDNLKRTIDKLRTQNYPFDSFLGAFSEMHRLITHQSSEFGRLDFSARRPLDSYSLLAIRAEGCLMFALREASDLSNLNAERLGLTEYIAFLANKRGLPQVVTDYFKSKSAKDLTQLHTLPPNPIGRIMAVELRASARDTYLVQAFLCCVLARNYFAHHHYLDDKLLKSKESAFMLGGILVTVLFLLAD